MEKIITIIAAIAGIAFWVGLINPKWVFMPNRKKSSIIYLAICLITAAAGANLYPTQKPATPVSNTEADASNTASTPEIPQQPAKPVAADAGVIDYSEVTKDLPAHLAEELGKLNLSVVPVMQDKTLVIAFNFDNIEELQARSAVQTVCYTYFNTGNKQRAWKAGTVEKVFITNDILTKGFVFNGGDKSCDEWAKKAGDDGDKFLNEKLQKSRFVAINNK
ncbi:hypothetical protein [Citrobacter freundii]|uniref:hypothetical protein n=1 Tax=Citrobacter freundii TaxID=546 RepID=UPI00301D4FBD